MSDSENKPQAKVDNKFNDAMAEDIENLQSSVQALQSLVSVSLMLVLVFTICLNVYVGMQMLVLRDQVHREQATTENFVKVTAPNITEFWFRLNDIATRNKDFAPVLTKYAQFFKDHNIVMSPGPAKAK